MLCLLPPPPPPSYANNSTNVLSIVKCPIKLFRKRRRVPFNGSNCLVKDQFANSLNWRNYVLGILLILYLIWISIFVTFLWFFFSLQCGLGQFVWLSPLDSLPSPSEFAGSNLHVSRVRTKANRQFVDRLKMKFVIFSLLPFQVLWADLSLHWGVSSHLLPPSFTKCTSVLG